MYFYVRAAMYDFFFFKMSASHNFGGETNDTHGLNEDKKIY